MLLISEVFASLQYYINKVKRGKNLGERNLHSLLLVFDANFCNQI